MSGITLQITGADGKVKANKSCEDECFLVYDGEYQKGDRITLDCGWAKGFYHVKLDDCMEGALVYYTGAYTLPVPFEQDKLSYNPKSFSGQRHYLYARKAFASEISADKNLAFNPYDFHGNKTLFPHTWANVETRGESVFASRNAVDGLLANTFHGEWPYTSWGINRDPAAEFHLDFGREVELSAVTVYLRADFPHDAWWKEGEVEFSDGTHTVLTFKKCGCAQTFTCDKKKVTSLVFKNLIKADDPSPFPALTQFQAWGREVKH